MYIHGETLGYRLVVAVCAAGSDDNLRRLCSTCNGESAALCVKRDAGVLERGSTVLLISCEGYVATEVGTVAVKDYGFIFPGNCFRSIKRNGDARG